MNATNYYVTACRLVIQANPDSLGSWQDIYRVLPMLRNSLSCTVCERLLTEPYTPEETSCQHHVCKGCRGGNKVIRCSWCKDYTKYTENVQLRILLQSYRKLCALVKVTRLFTMISDNKEHGQAIIDIISETDPKVPVGGRLNFESTSTTTQSTGSTRCSSSSEHIQIKSEVHSEEECDELTTSSPPKNVHRPGSRGERQPRPGVKRRRMSDEKSFDLEEKSFEEKSCEMSRDSSSEIVDGVPPCPRLSGKDVADEIISSPQPKKMHKGTVQAEQLVTNETEPLTQLKTERVECPSPTTDNRLAFQSSPPFQGSPLYKDIVVETTHNVEVKTELGALPDSSREEFFPNSPRASPLARSDTPSPPNVAKYSNLAGVSSILSNRLSPTVQVFKPKAKETFILQPRSQLLQESSGLEKVATSSRINLGWTPSGIRGPGIVSATPHLLPRADGRSLLKQSSAPTQTVKAEEPLDPKKAKKTGCRCGNATACPGKLTCCGQRCPCYVSRMACIGCKCKGCNNPNLPGGGKVLPYINAALNLNGTLGQGIGKVKRNLIRSSLGSSISGSSFNSSISVAGGSGSSVVRVPSGSSQDGDSMTDVDINTIPVVNLSNPSSIRTIPASLFYRLNKSIESSTPSASTKMTATSTLTSTMTSALTSVRVVPASSLSTVSIPLNSISAAGLSGLKLKPMDQLQHKQIKARVIPTSFRLKTAPYARVPVSGKGPGGGAIKLQTVTLMSLLQNAKDKNIQISRKKEENPNVNVDS